MLVILTVCYVSILTTHFDLYLGTRLQATFMISETAESGARHKGSR